MLAALSDDVEWVLPSIPEIPFSGAKHGKDGVAEFFGTMAEHQEPQSFEVQGIIAQGDQCCGARPLPLATTARAWEGEFSHHFTVQGGQGHEISRVHRFCCRHGCFLAPSSDPYGDVCRACAGA